MNSIRKIIALITFVFLFQGILFSQTQKNDTTKTKDEENLRARNTVYLELGGNCGLYSLNVEEELFKNINARMGFSLFDFDETTRSGTHNISYFVMTFMANYFLELGTNYNLELGAGVLYTGTKTGFTSTIGYRYNPQDGGFVFKIALTPFIIDRKMLFSGGIGFGYRF